MLSGALLLICIGRCILPAYGVRVSGSLSVVYLCYLICIYIYIYNKFTEVSHHNTLNIAQSRWM